MANEPTDDKIPEPFPAWLKRLDPLLAEWEQNGVYTAFYLSRLRRMSLVDRLIHFVNGLFMAGLIGLLVFLVLIYLTLFLIVDIGAWGFLVYPVCFVLLLAGYLFRSAGRARSRRLPLTFKKLFAPRLYPEEVLSDFRSLPLEWIEFGEAIILERTETEWRCLVAYYMAFVFCILAVMLKLMSFGAYNELTSQLWGFHGLFLIIVAAIASVFWAPYVIMELVMRRRRTIIYSFHQDHSARVGNSLYLYGHMIFVAPFIFFVLVLGVSLSGVFFMQIIRTIAWDFLIPIYGADLPIKTRLEHIQIICSAVTALTLLGSTIFARRYAQKYRDVWTSETKLTAIVLSDRIEKLIGDHSEDD